MAALTSDKTVTNLEDPVSSRLRARLKSPDAGVATQPAASHFTFSINKKRIIEEGSYFFGRGSQNQTNGRIYVYVEGDDSRVHEYHNHHKNTTYYCRPCFVLDKNKPKRTASWNHGVLRVPDSHICEPLPLVQVEEDQEKIKQKYATNGPLGNRVQRSRKRPVTATSTSSTVFTATPSEPRVLVPVRSNSPIPTSSKTLLYRGNTPSSLPFRRAGTPHSSFSTTPQGINKTTGGQEKNVSATKRKTKIELIDISKESDEEIIQQQSCGQPPALQNPFLLNVEQSAAQRFNILSTSEPSSASNDTSTPISPMPILQPMVLRQPTILNNSKSHLSPSSLTLQNVFDDVQSPIIDQHILTPNSSTPASTPLSSSKTPSSSFPSIPTSDSAKTIRFYKPSSFFLEKCCEKVGIEYQDEAYNFWSETKIDKVSSASTPKTVHSTSEPVYFGFDCLSILFTGAENQAQRIREKINQYIYQKNSESGLPINRETEGQALFSPSLTEYHLPWIAELFKCRIGIFYGNQWKSYGNWALVDGAPIILLEYKNSKYFLIMTFN